jgi:ABC-2 type transport system ATP-binding protein
MMVRLSNLSKHYGAFRAVDDISLEVERGQVFGFLGVNGAGKTTTLRMMAGVLQPTSGDIFIDGLSLRQYPEKVKAITGYIPDRPYLYSKLTAREFLTFVGDLYQVPHKKLRENIPNLLAEYGLEEWQHELIDSFSHGMKQRLATAAALVHDPKLLIIDEPMVGLDPHGAQLLKQQMRRFASEGRSIFLSTHSLNVAEEVSDKLAIIHEGRILTTGTLQDLRNFAGGSESGLEKVFLELTKSTNQYSTSHASRTPVSA